MRNLTRQQKKLLDTFYETIKHEHGLAVRDIVQELMPIEIWDKLLEMHECEILYDLANNYLHDKA